MRRALPFLVTLGVLACALVRESENKAKIASINETLPELWLFFEELSASVEAGRIGSTEQLIERCRQFYTAGRMAEIEVEVPGWRQMSSYADGKTLWHINAVMAALLQLDEYRSMSPSQQIVQQWVVLLHDLAKEPVDGRDHRHGFRSAAQAGRIMPTFGFPVTDVYPSDFQDWFDLADSATRFDENQRLAIHDNSKLPEILGGARRMFAEPTRTAVSVIALHQSITSLAAWPVKAPLTENEVTAYVDSDIVPVLAALTLADSGGWNLFDPPVLETMYAETRAVFRDLDHSSARKPSRKRSAGSLRREVRGASAFRFEESGASLVLRTGAHPTNGSSTRLALVLSLAVRAAFRSSQ